MAVWPGGFLACEEVLAAVQAQVKEAITQEDLTQQLAYHLGCRVRRGGRTASGR